MDNLSTAALNIAITQLGFEEKPRGSNWGHPVQDYLDSVGLHFPASWCLAFVYWCFDKAANQLEVPNPLIKTGGVLHAWNETESKFRASTPQIGSIFIMDLGHGLGHCGFVENVENGWIRTIDGNTNDTGSREGFEVCRKLRNPLKCKGFITY